MLAFCASYVDFWLDGNLTSSYVLFSLLYLKTFKCIENMLHFYILIIIKTAYTGMVLSMVGDHNPLKIYNTMCIMPTIQLRYNVAIISNDLILNMVKNKSLFNIL